MTRIHERFTQLRARGRKALIPYITAGDPTPGVTVDLLHAMVEAGADLLELGVPFSDPMADGPVIQEACERALQHGTSLTDVLGMVAEFRRQDPHTPIVLMGYLNPIEIMGYQAFAEAAKNAGVDGLLTVDLPPEEGDALVKVLTKNGIDAIFLLSPTSTAARISRICDLAQGFVYYVSLKGVTGASNLDVEDVARHVTAIREHAGELPVGVGFGIRDADTAAAVARVADAVVVGSVLVRSIKAHADEPAAIRQALSGILADMRQAMDQVE